MNILPAKKNSSWKDACKNLQQMFEKCPKILRECLSEREYKNFVDEFLIDIRATVIAMEDVCPIAKKNTLGEFWTELQPRFFEGFEEGPLLLDPWFWSYVLWR